MKISITTLMVLLLLYMSSLLCAQDEELSDEEIEAIAQRDMLEYMITYAPVRFDKNLTVGDKVVYRSKYDEESLNSVEVIKDTVGAFRIKEEFDGNIINYLISRETGELLDIKGYDEEGRFNHPQMLSDSEKEAVISKRAEKIAELQDTNLFTQSYKRKEFRVRDNNHICKVIESTNNNREDILVSESVSRMLPFMFGLELQLSYNVFDLERSGLVDSNSVELIMTTER